MDHLFSDNVKKIQESNIIQAIKNDKYDLKNYDKDCDIIEKCITDSYNSNEEDIEDLDDIITITNILLNEIILNVDYEDEKVSRMLQLRKYAKKMCNKKFRDYKYDDRNFWNDYEAEYQYHQVWISWRRDTEKIKELLKSRLE